MFFDLIGAAGAKECISVKQSKCFKIVGCNNCLQTKKILFSVNEKLITAYFGTCHCYGQGLGG